MWRLQPLTAVTSNGAEVKAFAKSRSLRESIFVLQMHRNILSLNKLFGRQCFKLQTEIKRENVMRNFMKTIQLIIFVLLTTLYSCDDNASKSKEHKVSGFVMPTINDTSKASKNDRNTIWLEKGNYNPLYIGQLKDSIYFSDRKTIEKHFVYDNKKRSYNAPDSSGILLLIDTTKIISDNLMVWEDSGTVLRTKLFKAFPVIVVNTTKDTLSIGYGVHLPIIMEAKDNKGIWKPIEEPYIYMCGTGLNGIILSPNEILLTSTPIYQGKFVTKLRLRYNNILSKEFYGTINLTQFESEWDEHGERKPLP